MELTYRKIGDYYLPNLTPPESPKVGKYGMLRRAYLRNHHRGLYTGMMLSGTLNAHLEEVDRQASKMVDTMTRRMAKEQGITEALKARDQMEWLRRMNSLRHRAEEMVKHDLIYT